MTSKTINPTTGWTWTDPVEPAGVVTASYELGIRDLNVAGSVAGSYPIIIPIAGANTAAEAFSAASAMLKTPGDYQSALRTVATNGNKSVWTMETVATSPGNGSDFSLVAPDPVPPTNFVIA